jgi:predicted SnoaL-like aldol condensation-catalyzing enzyme
MTGRIGLLAVMRACAFGALVACAAGCATNTALTQELAKSNTQTVLAFEETIYNKHQVQEGFEHYVGPVYRQHDPQVADGRDAAIRALTQLVARFPSSRLTVRRTIAQGNLVAVQLSWLPEPNRAIERVDIYRVEDGRIVEHWEVSQSGQAAPANASSTL